MAAVAVVVSIGSGRRSSRRSTAAGRRWRGPGRRVDGRAPPLQLHGARAERDALCPEADVVYAMVLEPVGQVAAHSRAPGAVGSTLVGPGGPPGLARRGPCSRRRSARDGRGALRRRGADPGGRQPLGHRAGRPLAPARWTPQIAGTQRELAALAVVALVAGRAGRRRSSPGASRGPVRQLADGVAAIARGRAGPAHRSRQLRRARPAGARVQRDGRPARAQRVDLEVADAALHRRFAELSDLKSYTDHILRSFVSGIVTLDLDGRVVTVNPAAEALTGCAANLLAGRPAAEVFAHVPELGTCCSRRSGRAWGCPGPARAAAGATGRRPGGGRHDAPPRAPRGRRSAWWRFSGT